MIVRMAKVALLCAAESEDATLDQLRRVGVVHLTHVRPPEGESVEKARHQLDRVRRALEALPVQREARPSGRPPREIVREVLDIVSERRTMGEELEVLRGERKRIAPFGPLDPESARRLERDGVHVGLHQAPRKSRPSWSPEFVHVPLGQDKTFSYFALIGRGDASIQDAERIPLPEVAPTELDRRIAETEQRLAVFQHDLEGFAGDAAALKQFTTEREERLRFLESRAGMATEGPVSYLKGFCPVDAVDSLREAVARHGWGLLVDSPAADDRIPTLIRYPRWVQPIKPVFDMIGILPGYDEVDISACFLVFFSVFFAILVGDAGYGAVFLGITLWAGRRFPQAPRALFSLLKIMSVCTIIWGALTGTWFGIPHLPGPLNALKLTWLAKEENVMLLCFSIGVLHLTIAHLWNIMRMWPGLQVLAQAGWLCTTWTMYFFALTMVLAHPFPRVMMPVFMVGVVLIVLFMTPVSQLKAEWFNHAMLPLNLVSNFVDVVSYIRLFAVGTASYAVAYNFNLMLGGLFGHWLTGLLAAVLLFLAHALNIALCLMGVMVHGVRLNTLEFSGHIGMQWTGLPYQPFCRMSEGSAQAAPGSE